MLLDLTHDDASKLLQLADAAVRASGLQAVRQAVWLMDRIDAAAAAEQADTTTDTTPES